jgi:hypothetical protein
MRLLTFILSVLVLCSCNTTHKIKIPKPPCLYPFVNYDFNLCQSLTYEIDDVEYTVPIGFTTNLASVPRILWSVYSPNKANTIPAAVIHDYLYFCPGDMKRSEADTIFYDVLIFNHVSVFAAFKYWLAVRTFGHSHFNKGAVCGFSATLISYPNGMIWSRNEY